MFTTQLFAFGDDPNTRRASDRRHRLRRRRSRRHRHGRHQRRTGRYATARGDADQELLGFNNPELPTMGINKTVELELARP